MSIAMDQEGNFRIQIMEYELKKSQKGATGIAITAKVLARWLLPSEKNPNGIWEPWEEYDVEVDGTLWIIGTTEKGEKINQRQAEAIMQSCGWNGSLDDVYNQKWKPTPCQCTVQENEYNGKTTYRINWVNTFDAVPGGGLDKVNANDIKSLTARYRSSLKALAGNVQRNAEPPATDKPTDPPPSAASDINDELNSIGGDDIPC